MRHYLFSLGLLIFSLHLQAQSDSVSNDPITTVQDAVYNRPFIGKSQNKIALGGYVEMNTNYAIEDGISDGFNMEMRRFNLFVFSQISDNLRFISELEFEHGTQEIALETAQLDLMVNPNLNVRAGIILVPIGGFNQNHDSPQWDFIDRPLVSEHLIPSTLSDVGFGINGKFYPNRNLVFTYDAYLSNGLTENILLSGANRTYIPGGKSPAMFGGDNNGSPMFSGKAAVRNRKFGEIGFSFLAGNYNVYQLDGETVDEERGLGILAMDYSFQLKKLQIKGEWAWSSINTPDDISENFGDQQWGYFNEFLYPIYKRKVLNYDNAIFYANLRTEYLDYNVGTFNSSTISRGDHVTAIVPGISVRPGPSTVFRVNYRYHWSQDVLNNPAVKYSNLQFGIASYF